MIMDKEYKFRFSYLDKDIYVWLNRISEDKKQYYLDKVNKI